MSTSFVTVFKSPCDKCSSKLYEIKLYGTAATTKHPVPDRVKLSFVIFHIRVLWRSGLSVRVPGCQKLQMTA